MHIDSIGFGVTGVLLLTGANVLLLTMILYQAFRLRRVRQAGHALRQDVAALQQDLSALCSGASSVGAHLGRVDRQLVRLFERQDQLELHDSVNQEYDHAVRLIRSGISIEQIMSQCNLARAEAELLMRLHTTMENQGGSGDVRGRRDGKDGRSGMRSVA